MAWIWQNQNLFFGTSLSSSFIYWQQCMMGFTSLLPHLPIKKPQLPPQPCHAPATAMLQNSSDATTIMSSSITTAETVRTHWLLCFLSVCSLIFGYCAAPAHPN
jgi:hypothetical protein